MFEKGVLENGRSRLLDTGWCDFSRFFCKIQYSFIYSEQIVSIMMVLVVADYVEGVKLYIKCEVVWDRSKIHAVSKRQRDTTKVSTVLCGTSHSCLELADIWGRASEFFRPWSSSQGRGSSRGFLGLLSLCIYVFCHQFLDKTCQGLILLIFFQSTNFWIYLLKISIPLTPTFLLTSFSLLCLSFS